MTGLHRDIPVIRGAAAIPWRTPGVSVATLLPCPFCGARPRLEPSPLLDDCVRIACGNEACHVRPRTEHLLTHFADELCAAWNERTDQE
jgi:hypothetical protein